MQQRVSPLHPRGATAIAAALRARSQAVGELRSARAGADSAQSGYDESVAACTVTERALVNVLKCPPGLAWPAQEADWTGDDLPQPVVEVHEAILEVTHDLTLPCWPGSPSRSTSGPWTPGT